VPLLVFLNAGAFLLRLSQGSLLQLYLPLSTALT
jgi:hypothetical protein